MQNRAASFSLLLALLGFTCACNYKSGLYVPVGSVAKVSGGDTFGIGEGEAPFADTPANIHLYTSARGARDHDAMAAMIRSGRVIFLPIGSQVDVLEHNQKEMATKVRVRSGSNIGREVWTHPKFISVLVNP